jgi:hypothetical protein
MRSLQDTVVSMTANQDTGNGKSPQPRKEREIRLTQGSEQGYIKPETP